MRLEHGIPSHDAFSDLFNALDPASFLPVMQRLAEARLVLGQVAVREKSNEITALPTLLDLKGRIVTADAMHTQHTTAKSIKEKGGDWLMVLKGNQGTLFEDVSLVLGDPGKTGNITSFQTVDADHGRIETRIARVCTDINWLKERHDWPGLQAIATITATRKVRCQSALNFAPVAVIWRGGVHSLFKAAAAGDGRVHVGFRLGLRPRIEQFQQRDGRCFHRSHWLECGAAAHARRHPV